jgi:hypothetical protein
VCVLDIDVQGAEIVKRSGGVGTFPLTLLLCVKTPIDDTPYDPRNQPDTRETPGSGSTLVGRMVNTTNR